MSELDSMEDTLAEAELEKPGHDLIGPPLTASDVDPEALKGKTPALPEIPEKWGGETTFIEDQQSTTLKTTEDLVTLDKQTGFVYIEDQHRLVVGKLFFRAQIQNLIHLCQDPKDDKPTVDMGMVTVLHTRSIRGGKS